MVLSMHISLLYCFIPVVSSPRKLVPSAARLMYDSSHFTYLMEKFQFYPSWSLYSIQLTSFKKIHKTVSDGGHFMVDQLDTCVM